MEDDFGEASRRRNAPRLYHKKSRTGCLRCKQRRVKCDEKKPTCTGCSRHGVDCLYPDRPAAVAVGDSYPGPASPVISVSRPFDRGPSPHPGGSGHEQAAGAGGLSPHFAASAAQSPASPAAAAATLTPYPQGPSSSSTPSAGSAYQHQASNHDSSSTRSMEWDDDEAARDMPETRDRRLLELRLLANYVESIHAARPYGPSLANPPPTFYWSREVPKLAMRYDSILYGVLAHSALNLWTQEPDPHEREQLRLHQQTYLGMAVHEQRRMVAVLGPENADALCMSSLVILAHAFALVQTAPPLEVMGPAEWEPPLEWLRIGRSTGTVFTVARAMLPSGPDDYISRFLSTPPHFDPDDIFTEENRAGLRWVLTLEAEASSELERREAADKITWRVYERALSYTGWVQKAIAVGEAEFSVHRRLCAFAVWMPEVYQDFCQQRRQRALVTLAWFFSLWIPYDHLWAINGTGKRQVKAIYENLDARWRPKLEPIMAQYSL